MDVPTTATTQGAIHVLATTFEGTRAALETAIPLARGSGSRLIVIVTKVVPYVIALDQPVDSTEFVMRRYRDLVTDLDGEAQFRLCMCRGPDDVLTHLLPPRAIVVLGGATGGLFPSQEAKLVRRMSKLGHHVIFVPVPQENTPSRYRSVSSFMSIMLAVAAVFVTPRPALTPTQSPLSVAAAIVTFDTSAREPVLWMSWL